MIKLFNKRLSHLHQINHSSEYFMIPTGQLLISPEIIMPQNE